MAAAKILIKYLYTCDDRLMVLNASFSYSGKTEDLGIIDLHRQLPPQVLPHPTRPEQIVITPVAAHAVMHPSAVTSNVPFVLAVCTASIPSAAGSPMETGLIRQSHAAYLFDALQKTISQKDQPQQAAPSPPMNMAFERSIMFNDEAGVRRAEERIQTLAAELPMATWWVRDFTLTYRLQENHPFVAALYAVISLFELSRVARCDVSGAHSAVHVTFHEDALDDVLDRLGDSIPALRTAEVVATNASAPDTDLIVARGKFAPHADVIMQTRPPTSTSKNQTLTFHRTAAFWDTFDRLGPKDCDPFAVAAELHRAMMAKVA